MTKLLLAQGLKLPTDAVTQVFAFLGRRGSGKTYGATKLAELLHGAGAQIVALDPVGSWYGLRLAADGKAPGLEIPVFGGLHGDLPLEPTAGALIADLIVDRGISAVIDVSQLVSAEQARFATAFATRLFERQKGAPSAMHLFLEECQEFIPQNPQPGEQHMLHAFQRLVKLGRNFGIGVSLISQRPQEVAKKVLNMTECMLAFQMTGPHERKAISAYVDERGADKDVIDILPKLKIGHAHVWSPQWLEVSADVHIEPKGTFDASSTPKLGAKAQEARPLAPIDLEKLKVDMAATIEKAKADDPRLLRAEIARLKKEKVAPAHTPTKPIAVVDEAAIERAITVERRLHRANLKAIGELVERAAKRFAAMTQDLADVQRYAQSAMDAMDSAPTRPLVARPHEPATPYIPKRNPPASSSASPFAPRRAPAAIGEGEMLTGAQQKLLNALAAFEQLERTPVPSVNAAFFAGYSEGGTFSNVKSSLRTLGLLDYAAGGALFLTAEGRTRADGGASIATLEDLHRMWFGKLSSAHGKLLRVLLGHFPEPIPIAQLAEESGYVEGGTFSNLKSRLRSLGAAEYMPGRMIVATDALFPAGLA